jgi:hypothetical protein
MLDVEYAGVEERIQLLIEVRVVPVSEGCSCQSKVGWLGTLKYAVHT